MCPPIWSAALCHVKISPNSVRIIDQVMQSYQCTLKTEFCNDGDAGDSDVGDFMMMATSRSAIQTVSLIRHRYNLALLCKET